MAKPKLGLAKFVVRNHLPGNSLENIQNRHFLSPCSTIETNKARLAMASNWFRATLLFVGIEFNGF